MFLRFCSILFYAANQLLNRRFDVGVGLHAALNTLAGVHNGGMIPTAEGEADLGSGILGYLAHDVHRYLPGEGDGLGSLFSPHIVVGETVVVGYHPLDNIDGDVTGAAVVEDILELLFGNLQGYPLIEKVGIRD